MARLAYREIYSDDEFPDLSVILERARSKRASSTSTSKENMSAPSPDGVKSSRVPSTTSEAANTGKRMVSGSSGQQNTASKPKRRVLNSTSSNALLLPLGALETTRNSEKKRQKDIEVFGDEERIPRRSATRNLKTTKAPALDSLEIQLKDLDIGEETDVKRGKKTVRAMEEKEPLRRPQRRTSKKSDISIPERSVSPLEEPHDEDQEEDEESEGMSDFIVDDDEDDDFSDVSQESIMPPPRKLKSRSSKNGTTSASKPELKGPALGNTGMPSRNGGGISETIPQPETSKSTRRPARRLVVDDTSEDEIEEVLPKKNSSTISDLNTRPASSKGLPSDREDLSAVLTFSPPRRSPSKTFNKDILRPSTPPASPTKPNIGLVSPSKKLTNRIPATPHRPSMDAFWSQDVINDWNEEYSPKKLIISPKKNKAPSQDPSMASKKSPVKKNRAELDTRKSFEKEKHDMAAAFLKELDEKITNGQIAQLTASTGGIKIIWSKKLNTTAGRANWKRETLKSSSSTTNPTTPSTSAASASATNRITTVTHRHHASIELAEKVIDSEHRLLNVLAHEFCHLCNFMISNIKNNPHGKEFKIWASKCSNVFGDRGIEVTTKHTYEIDYKYVWECAECGVLYKRHSKSIDIKRHRCGSCKGVLTQIRPTPREAKGGSGLGEYQAFVKSQMKIVREENPGSPQKEIMGLVGKRYQEHKARKEQEAKKSGLSVEVNEVGGKQREASVDTVVRKLEFMDLTGSP